MQHGIAQQVLLHFPKRVFEMDVMWFVTTDKLSVVSNYILLDLICIFQGAPPCSNHSHAPRDRTLDLCHTLRVRRRPPFSSDDPVVAIDADASVPRPSAHPNGRTETA